jgi:hypothetical protein
MEILHEIVPVWLGILLTLLGMFVYNLAMIFPKAKRFSQISIKKWWNETQIRFCMSAIVIAIIFYMGWYYDTLTGEHCVELGLIGNMVIGKLIKTINNGKE